MFLASSALGSVGMYTPLFYLGEHVRREEEGEAALLLLHLWLGLAATSGCLLAGYITTSDSYNFYISRRLLVQVRGQPRSLTSGKCLQQSPPPCR